MRGYRLIEALTNRVWRESFRSFFDKWKPPRYQYTRRHKLTLIPKPTKEVEEYWRRKRYEE